MKYELHNIDCKELKLDNKVSLIYIDPPYGPGVGGHFVSGSSSCRA